MKAQDYVISSEKFVFRSDAEKIHDTKLETKPVSYFRDALNRFTRNKASIVATVIIGLLVLFAIIGPILSPYTVAYEDKVYAFARPKNELFYNLGIPFWDGGAEKTVNEHTYRLYRAIEQELGTEIIMSEPVESVKDYMGKQTKMYSFRVNTYTVVGAKFVLLSTAEYQALQAYQDETGIQVILPITNLNDRPAA
ncbi:MAG: hypothetical protein IKW53_00205 [Clostridia bacterium]|nr:hypothetical protein [Clostridia bacterium]